MDYQFWVPIIISILSAIFAFRANMQTKQQAKESFKNNLRDGLKNAKYKILELDEKEYSIHREKMFIIESILDNLMYQAYPEEKKNYLTPAQEAELSTLQSDIEDNLGLYNAPFFQDQQIRFFNSTTL